MTSRRDLIKRRLNIRAEAEAKRYVLRRYGYKWVDDVIEAAEREGWDSAKVTAEIERAKQKRAEVIESVKADILAGRHVLGRYGYKFDTDT